MRLVGLVPTSRLSAFFVDLTGGTLPVILVSPMRLPFLLPYPMRSLADSLQTFFHDKAPFDQKITKTYDFLLVR